MARRFGRHLYRLRKARGLSQKEIGQLLGYSHGAVHQWERAAASDPNSTPPEQAEIILKALAALPAVVAKRGSDERAAEMRKYRQGFCSVRAALMLRELAKGLAELGMDVDVQGELNDKVAAVAAGLRNVARRLG